MRDDFFFQALSQTDSITVYKIPYIKGSLIPFNLNIIDTPGKALLEYIHRANELLSRDLRQGLDLVDSPLKNVSSFIFTYYMLT